MPKTILVTGAAGEIGSRLARRLHEQGHQVRALVLPGDPLVSRLGETAQIHFGDVTKADTLPAAMAGVEVVYHLAAVLLCERTDLFQAVNVDGTRHVAEAAEAAGVGHLIHISSASVVYPKTTHYSRSKRQAEDAVRASKTLHWTLVRPTLVYDRDGGLEFKLYADFVRRYPVVPLVAGGHARKSPVHVDDLLAGLVTMAGNPVTYGKTYNLSGGEIVTLRELAVLMLEQRGRSKPMVTLPAGLCRIAARLWGTLNQRPMLMEHTLAGLTQDADLDHSAATLDLGYQPVGVRKGILR
ncbi:MAG TPA: NAD-dependent epimerase/dehydratase family protein [Polyangia bacterium]